MNQRKQFYYFIVLFVLFQIYGLMLMKAQDIGNKEQINEITIYAMPTMYPIVWDSPAELYSSTYKCLIKTALVPDNYLLGHIAISVRSTLLPATILTGMKSSKAKEKIDYVLKQKIGFAILGATMAGEPETKEELEHKLNIYTKRKKLAFITYRINEQAATRIINFINEFNDTTNKKIASSNYYGGAFWPRYLNEGAGCSAFAMALLDVANLLTPETNNWLIDLKIPMKLIGGEYNNNKKIKKSTIRKATSWYKGSGIENTDYLKYRVHDPSVLFDWIINERNVENSKFTPTIENGAPGLYIDCRNIKASMDDSLFTKRPDSNIFIDKYHEKRDSDIKKKN